MGKIFSAAVMAMAAGGILLAGARYSLAAAPAIPPAAAPASSPAPLPFKISKQTTVITAPLLADGTPDYLAVLNQKFSAGVSPDNNALLPLLEIRGDAPPLSSGTNQPPDLQATADFYRLAGAKPQPKGAPAFQPFDTSPFGAQDQYQKAQTMLWTSDQFPDVAKYLGAQSHFFELAATASSKPKMYIPFVAAGTHLADAEAFSMVGVSGFARAWMTRANLRGGSGDIAGAITDAAALKRLGRLYASTGTIIAVAVGNVFNADGDNVIGLLAGAGNLTAAQCDACQAALGDFPADALAIAYQAEHFNLIDGVIDFATGAPPRESTKPDDQTAAMLGSIDRQAIDWNALFTAVNQRLDREQSLLAAATPAALEAASAPLNADDQKWAEDFLDHGSNFKRDPGESPADYTQRFIKGTLQQRPWSEIVNQPMGMFKIQERRRMLELLLAAAKWKAQMGDWPKNPGELVPGALKEIPADLFSQDGKQPVRLVVRGSKAGVSSVGPDHQPRTGDDLWLGDPAAKPEITTPPPQPRGAELP